MRFATLSNYHLSDWLMMQCCLFTWWINTRFGYSDLTLETGGFELASTITLVLQTNGNHTMEPQTVGHVILELHWKSTFDFSEFVNSYSLKRGIVWQIEIFISQFYLKLYIQFWKYFCSMILERLVRGYCKKKNGVLEFLARLSAFKWRNSTEHCANELCYIFIISVFLSSCVLQIK